MKKLLIIFICFIIFDTNAFAEANNVLAVNIPVSPQNSQISRTSIEQCCDTISMNTEQLFYLTLATLNKMNFKIKEIQSKTGTVIFQAYSKEFVVTIADKGSNSTFIKIIPTDSNYTFSPAIVQNIFGFLKANSNINAIIL